MPSSNKAINNNAAADVKLLSPPKLDDQLTKQEINFASRHINLRDARSFKSYGCLSPHGQQTLPKVPLHYIGSFRNWRRALSSIYSFNALPPVLQEKELDISKNVPHDVKKIYWSNIKYLSQNRPQPLPSITHHAPTSDINKLVALSAARARAVPPTKSMFELPIASSTTTIISKSVPQRRQPKSTTVIKKNTTIKHRVNNNRPINQELIGTTCQECGYVLTTKIYEKAIQVSYTDYDDTTEYDCSACIQCMEGDKQYNNQLERNKNLQNMYNKQQQLPANNVPSQIVHVDMETFVTEQLGIQYVCDIMSLYPKPKLKLNVLATNEDALSKREYYNKVDPINGAHWLVEDYNNPHPNIISHDESVDFTIVKLRKHYDGKQDFLAISNAHYNKEDVNMFCAHEMSESISQGVTANRAGPAGGLLQLNEESYSHTKVTQQPTSLKLAASSKGVAMRKLYYNNSGVVKLCNFGYRKIAMTRLTKNQKYKQAVEHAFYRNILIKEALAYIASIACIMQAGVAISSADKNYFSNLKHVLAANVGKSIEHCLVLWMTNTGEMRNHQALACHTDTNKSHPMEIYSLFHRTGRKKMNGLLYLPLNNACIRVLCDEQIVVCNLAYTPHVPDQSRNTNNISKVHGPKP